MRITKLQQMPYKNSKMALAIDLNIYFCKLSVENAYFFRQKTNLLRMSKTFEEASSIISFSLALFASFS